MKLPSDVSHLLAQRYQRHERGLLRDADVAFAWPLEINLDIPSEVEALKQQACARRWTEAWQQCHLPGRVLWTKRRWRVLGTQTLPERLLVRSVDELVVWAGTASRWQRIRSRYDNAIARRPTLRETLINLPDVLHDYNDADFERLFAFLDWVHANPQSNLYLRQVPVAGIDTKWAESRRRVLTILMGAYAGAGMGCDADFFKLSGLRPLPATLRVRPLDLTMRQRFGGLSDMTIPVDNFACTDFGASTVLIVENVQTGLALEDMPNTLAVMGLGYRVDVLGAIDWLKQCRCLYWGDIDTHGFAIVNRARAHLPQLQTLMMDVKTLIAHRTLWGTEDAPVIADLPLLTEDEHATYDLLCRNQYGLGVRLEQERLEWTLAARTLQALGTGTLAIPSTVLNSFSG